MDKKKENDCFICAFGGCEDISWKKAKRRLNKIRSYERTKKNLSVGTKALKKYGIKGYTSIFSGHYKNIGDIFGYKKGVLLVKQKDGCGHALEFNGHKTIDNTSCEIMNNLTERKMSDYGISIIGAMVKNESSFCLTIKNAVFFRFCQRFNK